MTPRRVYDRRRPRRAVAEFGFTQRQARFLELVMRHAGVCLLRQYSTFAGIVHGQKTRAFFAKLVSRAVRISVRVPTQSRTPLSRPSLRGVPGYR